MSAVSILIEACECDRAGRLLQAQHLYRDGIRMLLPLAETENDMKKRNHLINKIEEYKSRLDIISQKINAHSSRGEVVDNIPILEGSTGHSYRRLFGKYFDANVQEIEIVESYLMEHHQLQNLVAFLEMALKNCHNLRYIRVVTKKDDRGENNNQKQAFESIKTDLDQRKIKFLVEFQNDLHDRKIVLSNGYIIKIGRGLDIYKPRKSNRFSLGLLDYDYRECKKTEVDISKCKQYN